MPPNGTAPESLDKPLFEIVDGERVYLPHKTLRASLLTGDLFGKMYPSFALTGFGVVNCLFRLPIPKDRCRRPSIAFVSYSRWPQDRAIPNRVESFNLAPDLVTEVIGANDLATHLIDKTIEYFKADVKLVWHVYPKTQCLHAFDSPTSCRVLTRDDVLDGGSVLPAFELPLADLFPPPAQP